MDRTPQWDQHGAGSTSQAPAAYSPAPPAPRGGQQAPAAAAALGGRLPPGYSLLRQAGSGRHSTVLLCREEATGHEVAVKLLHLTVASSARRLAAHSELLSAGAAARHPCAVGVEDAGFTADRRPYLATRFCPGGSAQSRLAAAGPFPVEEVLAIGVRLALALHSSHRRGVLHLDVRPANILYDERGDALLADHGVARVIQRMAPEMGAVFDPMFSAREMFGWEAPGPAADVYSLGATLYALLAGEPAYSDAGRHGWAALYGEVLKGELPRPQRYDVPDPLASFLQRMMSAQPENRPPLTEVHRVLRMLLPTSYSSRVPDLEPEPRPEVPLPGWDPEEDRLAKLEAAQQSAADDVSLEADAEIRRRNRNRLIVACTVLVLFAGVATAVVLSRDEGGKPVPRTTAGPQGSAKAVPKSELPDVQAQHVSVTAVGKNVQVSWEAPKKEEAVAGYAIVAQSPEGKRLSLKSTGRGELSAVFTSPPVRPDTCYAVTALVEAKTGELQIAASDPVCEERG